MPARLFIAISNADYAGYPPSVSGRPPDRREFASLDDARAWLLGKRCGGAISYHDGHDWRSISVPPGGAA